LRVSLPAPAADQIVAGEPGELVVAAEADDHVLTGCAIADVGALRADDGRGLALAGRRSDRRAGGGVRVLGLVTEAVPVAVGLDVALISISLVTNGPEGDPRNLRP
jgi:hypothetical protein